MSFIKYLKLREVSEDDLEKINSNRDLHFNNIFGNKLRIVIPLEQDDNINKEKNKKTEVSVAQVHDEISEFF